MHLIVGLGNPGRQYEGTRHNIGFLVLDAWARSLGLTSWQSQFQSEVVSVPKINPKVSEKTLLMKPQTYMNNSGLAVLEAVQFFKIPLEQILVLQDDVDLPFGRVKFQHGRGHGGNNGIRSIHASLGSEKYSRLKIGVGRPPHPEMSVADYVLQRFSTEEQKWLSGQVLELLIKACEAWLTEGIGSASTAFNGSELIPIQRP